MNENNPKPLGFMRIIVRKYQNIIKNINNKNVVLSLIVAINLHADVTRPSNLIKPVFVMSIFKIANILLFCIK